MLLATMSLLSATEKYIATAKTLQIDLFDYTSHKIIDIPSPSKPEESDHITDITVSSDNKYLAVVTSNSKQLVLYTLPLTEDRKVFSLPRSVSKVRFSAKNNNLLVADKTGDVLIYNISNSQDTGTKLMGYLSLLLDVLQTNDEKFIITSDRDEKIRVSCYPNTYNINNYCLGHKEFVNHIELLPHDNKFLMSASGDGTVKIWDYVNGKICCSIYTNAEIDDLNLKNSFVSLMDEDEVEVHALPIVHFSTTKLDNSSIFAVTLYSYKMLLIYSVKDADNSFECKLETKLNLDEFPTSIQFFKLQLFIYDDTNGLVKIYNLINTNEGLSLELNKEERVFKEDSSNGDCTKQLNTTKYLESIRVLYKRKFDNVQDYQERKQQRLAKSEQN